MSRNRPPKYALHKASGQARVRMDGKDVYLGVYGSPESHQRYGKRIEEWLRRQDEQPSEMTIAEVSLVYLEHCKQRYRKHGRETSEVSLIRHALRHLVGLHRHTIAAEFSPRMLKSVRQSMIDAGNVRTTINSGIGRIRRMFRWAVSEELIPASVLLGLEAVQDLQRGRSKAAESNPVKPVPDAHIEAVLPYVTPPVRGMIKFQLATGARPGEARILRCMRPEHDGTGVGVQTV